MGIRRDRLYRLPWSKADNPGGWVEVTDECDLFCPGCYRHRLEGHRPLEDVKQDILLCKEKTNCDRMAVAGGEPLLYPDIVEVIDFIYMHKMKPVLLTNGEKLTPELARELKDAGLAKFHFHVDSGQKRPGWEGRSEAEMNQLREHYADLCWELGGVQCGYNITIFRSSLEYLPAIVDWGRRNIHKVQHISLVALRGIPVSEEVEYFVDGRKINVNEFQHISDDKSEIDITTDEMYDVLERHFGEYRASTYLSGTVDPGSYKFLVAVNIGSSGNIYGIMGARSMELVQSFHHFFKGRYCAFAKNSKVGKKVFLLALFDREVKRAFLNFIRSIFINPQRLFSRIYLQSISLQQPNEYLEGEANLCDGCLNMMIYRGKLIHSCRLDEYRLFGNLVHPVVKKGE